MKLATDIADRMLNLLVPRTTAAAACPGCGTAGTSCVEVQTQTCSVSGGTGQRHRRRTCYWGAVDCYKSCTVWGPWSQCFLV